jgi:predicted RNase H-like HicB family nuclease
MEYTICWDAEAGAFGIYEWCDVNGVVSEALDHGLTVEEAQERINELLEDEKND